MKLNTNLKSSFLFLVVFAYISSTQQARSPVILIPGNKGSRLEAKLGDGASVSPYCFAQTRPFSIGRWFSIWINLARMVNSQFDCWSSIFRLGPFDRELNKVSNLTDVQIRPYRFGSTKSVHNLDSTPSLPTASNRYFQQLIEGLEEQLNYERDLNLFAAPYDFRRGPDDLQHSLFVPLRQLIEIAVHSNNNQSATLICHSVGCPLSLLFLDEQTDEWRQKYVRRLVTLAGSFAGSVNAVIHTLFGESFNYPDLIDPLKVRSVLRTFPGVAFRYPIYRIDDDLVVTAGRDNSSNETYGMHNIEQLFNRLNLTDFGLIYSNAYQWALRAATTTPQVESWCLHSHSVPTSVKVKAPDHSLEEIEAYGKQLSSLEIVTGDGDSVVNIESLSICQRWPNLQSAPFHYKTFDNLTHMEMIQHSSVIDYIVNEILKPDIISNEPSDRQ